MCFIFCAGSPGPGRRQASETRAEASSAPTNHAAGSEEDSRGVSGETRAEQGRPGRRQETRAEASSAPTNHAAGSEEDSRGVSLPPPWGVGVAWLCRLRSPCQLVVQLRSAEPCCKCHHIATTFSVRRHYFNHRNGVSIYGSSNWS